MPSFDVASYCWICMPAAWKNVGMVLTFSGAAPALDSQSEDGVRKSS